jgi:hypothetical protein
MESPKTGKEFENLVAWINRCIHERAVITPNESILDKDTGRSRQVDLTIRLKDGPTQFLGIVEVRDRSRPVGVEYLEQVSSKARSVGADASFVVSSSGFNASAVEKAIALGIRLLTYEEAVSREWNRVFLLTEMGQMTRHFNNVRVTFLTDSADRIENPAPSLIEAVSKDSNAPIFLDRSGQPVCSLAALAHCVVNHYGKLFFDDLEVGNPPIRKGVKHTGTVNPPMFYQAADGIKRRVHCFVLEADFWLEQRHLPVTVGQYRQNNTVLAETASVTIQGPKGPLKLEFLAKSDGDLGAGASSLLLRCRPEPTNSEVQKVSTEDSK